MCTTFSNARQPVVEESDSTWYETASDFALPLHDASDDEVGTMVEADSERGAQRTAMASIHVPRDESAVWSSSSCWTEHRRASARLGADRAVGVHRTVGPT
jgi:hypothetical protein